jgi:hypothetical protein
VAAAALAILGLASMMAGTAQAAMPNVQTGNETASRLPAAPRGQVPLAREPTPAELTGRCVKTTETQSSRLPAVYV